MKIPLCIQHWEQPHFNDVRKLFRDESKAEINGQIKYAREQYNVTIMLSGKEGDLWRDILRFYFPDEETMFFILLKAPKYMPKWKMNRHAV